MLNTTGFSDLGFEIHPTDILLHSVQSCQDRAECLRQKVELQDAGSECPGCENSKDKV